MKKHQKVEEHQLVLPPRWAMDDTVTTRLGAELFNFGSSRLVSRK